MTEFDIKDSGSRAEFASGMVRDVTDGKIDYSLVLDGPMFRRWAEHLTKGALKYAKRNWMQARGQEELDRFRESALRHFIQWYNGDTDEDHAAATFFNMNGAEYTKEVIEKHARERAYYKHQRWPDDYVFSGGVNRQPPRFEHDGPASVV